MRTNGLCSCAGVSLNRGMPWLVLISPFSKNLRCMFLTTRYTSSIYVQSTSCGVSRPSPPLGRFSSAVCTLAVVEQDGCQRRKRAPLERSRRVLSEVRNVSFVVWSFATSLSSLRSNAALKIGSGVIHSSTTRYSSRSYSFDFNSVHVGLEQAHTPTQTPSLSQVTYCM